MSAHPDPEIRRYIERLGGVEAFAARHGIAPRNAQRIFSGQRPCPNRLRDEIIECVVADAIIENNLAELQKAQDDLFYFGTGAVFNDGKGLLTHVPVSEIIAKSAEGDQ